MAESAIETALATNAVGPQSAAVDGVQTSQHSLPDQIEADKYTAGKRAARARAIGFRIVKLIPPGAT